MKLQIDEINYLGNSLRRITNTTSEKIWYQGEEIYFNFIIHISDNDITWFDLTLKGYYLKYYSQTNILETGKTGEFEISNTLRPQSKLLTVNQINDKSFTKIVIQILECKSKEDEMIEKCIKMLKNKFSEIN